MPIQTAIDSISNNQGSPFGFKNRIINGGMVIDQRNAGASITPTSDQYGVDRFVLRVSQASKLSMQRNAGSVTPPVGFTNYIGITSLSSYSVTSTDYFVLGQYIEGVNISDLGWGTASAQTVTLSFWVRSSLTGTFSGIIENSDVNRSYTFTYTINSANTWEKKTITIPGDTTGSWLTTTGIGMRIFFSLGIGSSRSQTAGSWVAGESFGNSSAVSVVGTNAATFYITGVQLEVGSQASSFDFRSYTNELQLCQRYYEKGGISTRSGNRASGTSQTIQAYYKVQKRDTPTFAVSGGYTFDGWGTYNIGGHDNPSGSNDRLNWGNLEAIATSSVSAGGVIACIWTSIAEL